MDPIQSMKVFVRAAHRSGFAAAGRDLRMSPAAVTKHVAALEERLGARLFDRTTRRVALTEAGRIYLERCLECLQAFEDAESSVRQLTGAPKGKLRVTAPADFYVDLPRIIARFSRAHPDVTVELRLTNRPIDLIEDGVDVAVRVGSPSLQGDFIARPLAPMRVGLLASPGYIQEHGRPKNPREVARHRHVVFVEPRPRLAWTFARAGKKVDIQVEPVFLTNSGTGLLTAAAEGMGMAIAPSFSFRPFVDAGDLELLLPEWQIVPDLRLFAVYPHRRFVSPNVATFVTTLREAFGSGKTDPYWPGAQGGNGVSSEHEAS